MSDPFNGLGFPAPGGPYASVDDLLQVADLVEIDLRIDRWKKGGESLRIRVRGLSLEQQERIERQALIKVDGQVVRSESRFACLTLKEAVIVPQLTDAQAAQMRTHNPAIISSIVSFIWTTLGGIDQDVIDAIVEQEIPGSAEPAGDPALHDDGADDQDDPGHLESLYQSTPADDTILEPV